MCQRELPLLVVVEGENDICFLKGMSRMLHRADPELPDLTQLANDRQITFLPTGGSNLNEWVSRLTCLQKREFYLFDREQEPETSARWQVIEFINTRPGCFATLTTKRTVENYLHPLAIQGAGGIDLEFNDDTDVAGSLALKLMARSGETSWRQLPYKRQRRLHERAKKILNVSAVQRMTPRFLAQKDPDGEVAGWLRMIRQMVEEGHHQLDSLNPIREDSIMPVSFTDRELATILGSQVLAAGPGRQ